MKIFFYCGQVGAKLQGVFADSVTGLVCLIRKASISYLRPCELLERLYLCEGERLTTEELNDLQFGIEGKYLRQHMLSIVQCIDMY